MEFEVVVVDWHDEHQLWYNPLHYLMILSDNQGIINIFIFTTAYQRWLWFQKLNLFVCLFILFIRFIEMNRKYSILTNLKHHY